MRAAADFAGLRVRQRFRHQQPVQPVDCAEDDGAIRPVAFLQHAVVGIARGDQPLGEFRVRAGGRCLRPGRCAGALAGASS